MAAITMLIDCHAHDFDGQDGYPTLEAIKAEYDVDVRDVKLDDPHPMPGWETWATWYEVKGDAENVRRFLKAEYSEDDADAMVDQAVATIDLTPTQIIQQSFLSEAAPSSRPRS